MRLSPLVPVLALAGVALLVGCQRAPTAVSVSGTKPSGPTDPRDDIRDTLKSDSGLLSCRTLVQQMNAYLKSHPLAATSPATLNVWRHDLDLTDDEIAEINVGEFTLLDSYYLNECFLFRDAVRALEPTGTVAERATTAMDWMDRQMVRTAKPGQHVPAPPAFSLKSGAGDFMERLGVFLALVRQMGLPGAILGPTDDERTFGWSLVGVLDEASGAIYVFDPLNGRPLPGPGGKGIATLAQLRANPGLLGPWLAEGKLPWKTTPESITKAAVFLTPPLSALAPRMRALEKLLDARDRAVLAVDAGHQAEQFRAAMAKQKLPADLVRIWNPRSVPATPTRLLRAFLPPDEGGTDRTAAGRLGSLDMFKLGLVPWRLLPPLLSDDPDKGIPGRRGDEMRARGFGDRFIQLWIGDDSPRDDMLRGRFDTATAKVSERLDACLRVQERAQAEPNLYQEVAAWVTQYREVSRGMRRIQEGIGGGTLSEDELKQRSEDMKKGAPRVLLLLEQAASSAETGELTYLMALCKHEQFERALAQHRHPPAGEPGPSAQVVRSSWAAAERWWNNYKNRYLRLQPQRKDHVEELLARGRRLVAAVH